ncbi:MAG: sigma-70 family RNA polymerase sigma factor [Planctomycetes bacterium]|nr:sigma-70 family RNA polymerase sigma factor [Planctomycetota bacterium]
MFHGVAAGPKSQVEELLEHSGWARQLARKLVMDGAAADDLLQEAWVTALRSPPRAGVPLRPWLAGVLRNAARMSIRSAVRRSERERRAAREEATAATQEVVELAVRQRELVELLLGLDEPYRSTLLLRFFEALPPRGIAARMGVPVETVHTRLRRGLARLREVLEARHGDRTGWLSALLPLARAPLGVGPGALGLLTMNAKIPLTLCALTLLGALAWVRFRGESGLVDAESQPGLSVSEASPAPPDSDKGTADATAETAELRSVAPGAVGARPSPTPAVESVAGAVPVRGKVIDDLGRGVVGIALRLEFSTGDDSVRTISGAEGAFEFPLPRRSGRIVCDEDRLCTVLCGVARAEASKNAQVPAVLPVVVVARRISLAGHVYDEAGMPLQGAMVRAPEPEAFRTRFVEVLDASES